jgi:hypothetical protein
MDRPGHNNISFFVGTEVEHTPAHGHKTLFVVGTQDPDVISKRCRENWCEHIYFGANQSFPNPAVGDTTAWQAWESMIVPCLQAGYLCTLDIDVSAVAGLTQGCLVEYHNFIPMISVKIPHIQQLGYHATIKIDDTDFAKSNPGVWCHSLHDLRTRKQFTPWAAYTKDKVIT